jgi:methylamine dehydrogenase accessory protein MauD
MSALEISHLLLWLAVVALAGLVVVLLRQIGVLHERIAPAGALVAGAGPRPGEAAPVLEVPDWNGSPVRIGGADAEGRDTLLCFVSPTCPVCKALLPALRSLSAEHGERLRLVLASDGPRAEHEAFVRRERLDRDTYVLSAPLGRAWQVASLPFAALVDARGIVRAQGLVNTREHLESLFEARARGVASVQEYLARRRAAGGEDT